MEGSFLSYNEAKPCLENFLGLVLMSTEGFQEVSYFEA